MRRPRSTVRSLSSEGKNGIHDIYLVGFPQTTSDHESDNTSRDVQPATWSYIIPQLLPEARVFEYTLFSDSTTVENEGPAGEDQCNAPAQNESFKASRRDLQQGKAHNEPYFLTAKSLEEAAYTLLDNAKESDPASRTAPWKPVTFVGHGLGGLIVKQAMVIANLNAKYCDVALRTHQLIFIATPSVDDEIATWEETLDKMIDDAGIRITGRKSVALGELGTLVRKTCSFFDYALKYRVITLDSVEELDRLGLWTTRGSPKKEEDETSQRSVAFHTNMTEEALRDLLFPSNILSDYTWGTEKIEPSEFYSGLLDFLQVLSPTNQLLHQSIALQIPDSELLQVEGYLDQIPQLPSRQHCIQIIGPPGYGKSTLIKQVAQSIVRSSSDTVVLEIMYDYHDLENLNLDTILRSFIHQIISRRPALFMHIRLLYLEHRKICRAFTQVALWSYLHILLRISSKSQVAVVANNVHTWSDTVKPFLKNLEHFLQSLDSSYVMVISSNAELTELCPASNETIYTELDESYRASIFRNKVKNVLSEQMRLQGIHRIDSIDDVELPKLVSLTHAERYGKALSRYILFSTRASMEKALLDCPRTNDEISRQHLNMLCDDIWDWSQLIISWVHIAFRPLRTAELGVATALSNDYAQLSDLGPRIPCSIGSDIRRHLNVLFRFDGDVVHFYDATVGRFLTTESEMAQVERSWKLFTHDQVVRYCLQYITHVVSAESEQVCLAHTTWRHQLQGHERHTELGFLEYAVRQWPRHYTAHVECRRRQSKTRDVNIEKVDIGEDSVNHAAGDPLDDEVMAFLNDANSEVRDIWYKLFYADGTLVERVLPNNSSSLHIATDLDFFTIAESLISRNFSNLEPSELETLLCIAVRNDNLQLMDLFLDKGVKKGKAALEAAALGRIECLQKLVPNYEAGDDEDLASACLYRAAQAGNLSAVQFLLTRTINWTWRDLEERTLLHAAGTGGKVEILERLLQESQAPDINTIDVMGRSPLITASQLSHVRFVECLCSRKADATMADRNGKTALHYAVFQDLVIVQSLLERGASPIHPDNEQQTPLHIACKLGRSAIASVLIDALKDGESINLQNAKRQTPLHVAAAAGHLPIIRLLLQKGADLSVKDANGQNSLELAAMRGHLESFKQLYAASTISPSSTDALIILASEKGQPLILRYLVQNQRNVNFLLDGRSPLCVAAACGYHEVIRLLLQRSADPNFTNSAGSSPLHCAVEHGHFEVAEIFLDKGTNPNCLDRDRQTPLHIAASCGQADIVEILLKHGASPNTQTMMKDTPVHLAVQHPEIVEKLLEHSVDLKLLDYNRRTSLHIAVMSGNADSVQLLVDKDESIIHIPDEDNLTALHHALAKELWSTGIFQLLWSHQGALDQSCYTTQPVMLFAIQEENMEAVRFLLQEDAGLMTSRSPEGHSVITSAVLTENDDILDKLLERATEELLNMVSDDGAPLHIAAYRAKPSMLSKLLQSGADPNLKNNNGSTPLHVAAWSREPEIVNLLLDNKADPEIPSEDENAHPLHLGADSLAVLQALISRNVDINARDKYGWTPLMRAVYYEHDECVTELVTAGADIHLLNLKGQTALHLAERERNPRLSQILLDATADVNVADELGKTPLHYAAKSGDEGSKIQDLLDKGAIVNCRDVEGRLPLHLAADPDAESVNNLTLLIDAHIAEDYKIDDKDKKGNTPLHIALTTGTYALAKTLLDRGASQQERNIEGQSCLAMAAGSQVDSQEKIQMLLLSAQETRFWSVQDKAEAFLAAREEDTAEMLAQNSPDIFEAFLEASGIIVDYLRRDQISAATRFIELGANPFFRKKGTISAFEWAAHNMSKESSFIETCLKVLKERELDANAQFQAYRVLLEIGRSEMYPGLRCVATELADDDGWTMPHFLLQHRVSGAETQSLPTSVSMPLRPTCLVVPDFWKVKQYQDDIFTFDDALKQVEYTQPDFQRCSSVRADHPFPPRGNGPQYFEVKFTHNNPSPEMLITTGIGLCSEFNDLGDGFPGWDSHPFSIGYHGDVGYIVESSKAFEKGQSTGILLESGDIAGCGIDWEDECVYFTINGKQIGVCKTDLINRKLYPVISMESESFTARVNWGDGWDDDGEGFMFNSMS